jgi:hypothetical protein
VPVAVFHLDEFAEAYQQRDGDECTDDGDDDDVRLCQAATVAATAVGWTIKRQEAIVLHARWRKAGAKTD